MMGNIHIQPYNPEYIGVLHIFGDFKGWAPTDSHTYGVEAADPP